VKTKSKIIIIFVFILIAVIAFFYLFKPILILQAGEAGVVFNRIIGVEKRILKTGMNFLVPFLEKPYIYKTQIQSYTAEGDETEKTTNQEKSIEALTKDGQKVKVDISILYKIDEINLWKLHNDIGPDYLEKIIIPYLRTEVRNVLAMYSAITIYSSQENAEAGRIDIQNKMLERLKDSLKNYYIVIDSVLLRKISFSDNFVEAIEKKQIEQQKAEALLIATEAQKKATIITASANAEALTIVGQVISQYPQVINYLYIEKIAPTVQTIITNQPTFLSIPKNTANVIQ
jgi:regulator of protease activity HflC (stomatin/prohibitin superfamily)